jgi:hypothetical protein
MEHLPADAAARRPRPGESLEFSPAPLRPPQGEVRVRNLGLWLAALGGPVSWAIHLMVVYPLVEVACRFQTMLPLYGASAVLLASAGAAGLVNWGYLRGLRGQNGATTPRRIRFMATAGLAGAILFMILIVAGTLPMFFDDPCQLPGRRRPTLIPFI